MSDVQQNQTINFMVPASGGTNVCSIPLPDTNTGGANGYTIDWKSLASFIKGKLFIPQAVTVDLTDLASTVTVLFEIPALAFKRNLTGGGAVTFQFPAMQDLVTSLTPSDGTSAFRTFWYDYPAFPDCCGEGVVVAAPAVLVEGATAEKISAMTAAAGLTGAEEIPAVQGGANVRTTAQDIADLAPATPVPAAVLVESGAAEKISAMSAAGALAGTEEVPIVQTGANVRTTAQDIANLAPGGAAAILVESGAAAKVSALSAAGALAGTEEVPIVQSGGTVRTTAQDIANLAPGGGAYNSSIVLQGSGISLSSGVTANVTSIIVPAGAIVWGEVWINTTGTFTKCKAGLGTTSATLPSAPADDVSRNAAFASVTGDSIEMPLVACKNTSGSAATFFLTAQATITSGATTAFGKISYRT